MKREYFQFTIEELIENRDFVAWVLQGENQKEWEVLLAESPEFQPTVKKARKIVELLRDRQDSLGEADILAIWRNIENFDNLIRNRSRQIKMQRFLRYAAILVVTLLISSTGIWMIYQNQKGYVFLTNMETETVTQSRLFLSNGTTINLKKENSKIALNAEQMVVIDNDEMIDLSKDSNPDEPKMNEVIIPYGKKSQLVLEDGTKVWLNAGSRMAFPTKFIGKKREVFLEGEAYFEVAHNKDLPFIVSTNDISVKVLGTKFNLSAYKSDQLDETVLLEGKVVVSEKSAFGFMKGETILTPNQKASYDKEHKHISVKNEPNVELVIAWTEGWLNFSRQNLDEVLNKLQRYYSVQFVFDSDFSTADLITGKLDLKDSIEQVMLALGDVANIQFRIKGDKIYIAKKISEIKMRK